MHLLSGAIDWPMCEQDGGCQGIQLDGFGRCLAHLHPDELHTFLDRLEPEADLDLGGTTITGDLLERVKTRFWVPDKPFVGYFAFGAVSFSRARFTGRAWFGNARFHGYVRFDNAAFDGEAGFRSLWFRRGVTFTGARFGSVTAFGPIRAESLYLNGARFTEHVEMELAANSVSCDKTRFDAGVTVRLTPGDLDASGATLGAPSSIVGTKPFPDDLGALRESWPAHGEPCVTSLRDADVSNLRLTDVNLATCEFAGADGLDQLRITGHCPFNEPPRSWRWTRRQLLVEERRWRAWPVDRWINEVKPETLAGVYRSLRKSLEDSKNEAGAGDFYYGEMEMRRHATTTRWAERRILDLYWLLSGYGQRAGRALAVLLSLITTVAVVLLWTGQPAGEAAQIAIGAVVFRDPGTQLTEAGQWTVMVARILGPVLLALAVLAVRARVKR